MKNGTVSNSHRSLVCHASPAIISDWSGFETPFD
jgi:hypothetical protein